MKINVLLGSLLLVSGAGVAFAQGKTEPALDKLTADFAAAFNAKDAAKVASFYAEDAVLMPPDERMVTGRGNIEAYYRQGLTQGAGRITLKPIESGIAGARAFEAGTSVLASENGDGRTVPGKDVVIYKRAGKEWKIAYDIFSDDALPPPPPK